MKRTVKDDITRRLELTEEYDRTFGLMDHAKESDLMSVMYQHPEEDPVTGSRTETLSMELITLRIPELLNEGLSTILANYPRWWLDKMIERVRKLRTKEAGDIPPLPKT